MMVIDLVHRNHNWVELLFVSSYGTLHNDFGTMKSSPQQREVLISSNSATSGFYKVCGVFSIRKLPCTSGVNEGQQQ